VRIPEHCPRTVPPFVCPEGFNPSPPDLQRHKCGPSGTPLPPTAQHLRTPWGYPGPRVPQPPLRGNPQTDAVIAALALDPSRLNTVPFARALSREEFEALRARAASAPAPQGPMGGAPRGMSQHHFGPQGGGAPRGMSRAPMRLPPPRGAFGPQAQGGRGGGGGMMMMPPPGGPGSMAMPMPPRLLPPAQLANWIRQGMPPIPPAPLPAPVPQAQDYSRSGIGGVTSSSSSSSAVGTVTAAAIPAANTPGTAGGSDPDEIDLDL
jgi:hypothetical protein